MKKTLCLLLLASTALLGACGTKASSSSSSELPIASSSSSATASTSTSASTSVPTSSSATSASASSSTSEDTTTFAVRFYGDNDVLLEETSVKKGGTAVYSEADPTKDPDDHNTYQFTGWDKALTNIQADTDFHAVFSSTAFAYKAIFQNPDGEVLSEHYVHIGDTPDFYSDDYGAPYQDASATKYYTFKAWDKPFTAISDADQVYTATYSESDYSLTYSFDTDHYSVTGISTTKATGYFVPDVYDDGTHGEYPVTTIATQAFTSVVNGVVFLKLGKNVTTIQSRAFFASWFSRITVEEGSPFHTSADHHVLYNDSEVIFFATYAIPVICDTYTIADGATAIGDSVFYWNHYIGTLNLPDSVIAIKAYAFFSSYIENLNLGAGLQTIGYAAFRSTTVLKSITLPNTLTSIGEEAFDSATKLTTVNYKGTTADWAKVTLGTNWHRNAAFTAITCSDGSVTL
jgi:hypothetical protein